MNDNTTTALSVLIKESPPVHVAYIAHALTGEPGEFDAIRECFQRVQAWVRERGYDPFLQLNVGALRSVDGRPSSYDCCVQVPDQIQSGSGEVKLNELPGGRYAVVSIRKDPAIIGDSIRRFYQEYVPQNQIEIDPRRPTCEIYFESMMEYCAPIL
jgi:DNA gyrase inhibitor GyrI